VQKGDGADGRRKGYKGYAILVKSWAKIKKTKNKNKNKKICEIM